ncbi:alpha-N-acetylgalactosaminide alpha-2,6-sialyltransferase 1-like [Patagioenas fasciata]|uniref:alpha-N-acetylgalactosaminide alpha-2,6-sialyltransferase 1-like n=1 Tax=Patagioenas fasciata TaxID=372321 RepID=UPI003A9A3A7A
MGFFRRRLPKVPKVLIWLVILTNLCVFVGNFSSLFGLSGSRLFRPLSIFQRAPDPPEVDTRTQQDSKHSGNGSSRGFLKVTLGKDVTRLKRDVVERTPRWDGKEEQKKMMKSLAKVEEAKGNTAVKPSPGLEGVKKTTVKIAPRVQGNKEKTTVRPAPRVEEAKEETIVKPLPREEGAKEKATAKPPSGVEGTHENNISKDQTKPKDPPASVKTVRPIPQAAAVTEKKVNYMDKGAYAT